MILCSFSSSLVFLILPILSRALLVEIDQGVLSGKISTSRGGHKFYNFFEIPYAQSPINQLRFQPPKWPPPSWEGARPADEKRSFCPQINAGKYFGSEDCLYLHISTRDIKPEKLMPVLVFFHGGAFNVGGAALYDADFFMDKSMVFVSVNSRLGIFGFFSTGDSSYPGNYALKDQVAALEWVQKYIHAFGGDSSEVTIVGHSSGAACVHFHTLSPSSKDLFHRSIMQSGVATITGAFVASAELAKQTFLHFLQHTNCVRASVKESVECLQALSAEHLKELEITFPFQYPCPNCDAKFLPVIESSENEGAFLVTDPHDFAYPGPPKPTIFGFTTNEVVGLDPMFDKILPSNATDEKVFRLVLPKKLHYEVPDNPELTQNVTKLIKRVYFEDDLSNFHNTIASSLLISDMWFKLDIVDCVRGYPGVKYVYEFNGVRNLLLKDLGAGHGDELQHLFPHKGDLTSDDEPREMSSDLIAYWSNFVLTGDPNTPDNNIPVKWIPAENDMEESFLYIGPDGFLMKQGLMPDKRELLTSLKECRKFKVPGH